MKKIKKTNGMEGFWKEMAIIGGFYALATAPMAIAMVGIMKESERSYANVEQARTLSAGEDKVWSTSEQREFLDDMGIEKILSSNENLRLYGNSNGAKVLAGTGEDDRLMGFVSNDQLEAYYKAHGATIEIERGQHDFKLIHGVVKDALEDYAEDHKEMGDLK